MQNVIHQHFPPKARSFEFSTFLKAQSLSQMSSQLIIDVLKLLGDNRGNLRGVNNCGVLLIVSSVGLRLLPVPVFCKWCSFFLFRPKSNVFGVMLRMLHKKTDDSKKWYRILSIRKTFLGYPALDCLSTMCIQVSAVVEGEPCILTYT